MKNILTMLLLSCVATMAKAQFLMDMVDTTTEMGRGMLSMYKKMDGIKISGYIQPQYQLSETKGIQSFEGGNFGENVSSRLMLRRSRIRFDYVHFAERKKPGIQVVFQMDASEKGFSVRDMWGRITENNLGLFNVTAGVFARPFGYEINLSSSDRETPERGRMSQQLMRSERDLGVMLGLDARGKYQRMNFLQANVGFFNGQGIAALGDFDNYKDLIARLGVKPIGNKYITVSGGVSILNGGLVNNTKYVYRTVGTTMGIDSSAQNYKAKSPRRYYGADVQVRLGQKKNLATELRGEIISGTQTGSLENNETPFVLKTGHDGYAVRNFSGAYFYFIQNLMSVRWQFVAKYDFYDPNTSVLGSGVDHAKGFTDADVRFETLDVGINYYLSPNIKFMAHYAYVKNEKSLVPGYEKDIRDNVFTCRAQFRF